MAFQTVFQRYEMKYMITKAQKEQLLASIKPYMKPDDYGRTIIKNIYYDTEDYRLIRRSLERPVYKEKLRVRSYGKARAEDVVFVELKKKYRHVVYKRRLALPQQEAVEWLNGTRCCEKNTQITQEIDYFLHYYGDLSPKVFLSYKREAYFSKDGSDFRMTFDDDILCRQSDFSLASEVYGTRLLEPGKTLLELKCFGGIPLWLVRILSREQIYKTSFSKYGTAYETLIFPKLKEASIYA